MQILIVVHDLEDWSLNIAGVALVDARSYLTEPQYSQMRRVKVFNLCRSYRYQSVGYYVSLLAEARGHRPQPNVATIQDMKMQTLARLYSEELDDLIQSSLASIRSVHFTLSIYFGFNLAKRYNRLSLHLFNLFPAPLLRALFVRDTDGWRLQRITPIPTGDISDQHADFVTQAAVVYFAGHRRRVRRSRMRYDLAILHHPHEPIKPSNAKAIDQFIKAARSLNMEADVVEKSDIGRIAEFDALFIRDTTAVNHYTYRFSRRARAEGLAVIDDPDSILKCANKVYLAQLLERHRISTPKTMIIHRGNAHSIVRCLGLPCILKQPDGSFSQGVVKIEDSAHLTKEVARLLDKSDLIVGQEFTPTDFDWRIGLIDGVPLYACKYHMAPDHWQIIKRDALGKPDYGKVETVLVENVPEPVLDTAVRAASFVGDGLYGVDLKQVKNKCCVIEINDNPSIDAGFEDVLLKNQLYVRIMQSLLRRIENRSTRSLSSEKSKTVSI